MTLLRIKHRALEKWARNEATRNNSTLEYEFKDLTKDGYCDEIELGKEGGRVSVSQSYNIPALLKTFKIGDILTGYSKSDYFTDGTSLFDMFILQKKTDNLFSAYLSMRGDSSKGVNFTVGEEFINLCFDPERLSDYEDLSLIYTTLHANIGDEVPDVLTIEKEDEKMANNKLAVVGSNILAANKDAVVTAAKLEAGRIATKQVVALAKPHLPLMIRGYAETPVGTLVIANLFKLAVDNFAASNPKAVIVADAMLQGAMLEALQSLSIEKMVNDVINKVDVSKLAE